MRNRYKEQIIKHLEKAGGWSGVDNSQTFDDFLELARVSLEALPRHYASAVATGKMAEDTDEGKALFSRIRDRYTPAAVQELSKAFAVLMDSANEWGDTIGDVYMEFGYPSTRNGQFFTPYPIAKMNAKILAEGVEQEIHKRVKEGIEQSIEAQALLFAGLCIREPDEAFSHFVTRIIPAALPHIKPITVNDPACGSGVMFIAFAEQCPRWALDYGLVQFYGMDIDPTCVAMARVNCMLYGLNGYRMKHVLELSKYDLQAIPEPYKTKYQEAIETPEKLSDIADELAQYKQMSLF